MDRVVAPRREQRTSRLTPEGWGYVTILGFIAFGAVLRNVNLLVITTGMMVIPLVFNWRIGVAMAKRLTLTRLPPRRMHVGELVTLSYTCRNQDRRIAATNVVVRDVIESVDLQSPVTTTAADRVRSWITNLVASLRKLAPGRLFGGDNALVVRFANVPAQQAGRASSRCLFSSRGVYDLGPAEILTSYPFGLVAARIQQPDIERVFVAPAIGKLNPDWEQRISSTVTGDNSVQRRRGNEEDAFYAMRQWRSGDNPRNIHWRSTAKRSQPMVKQFDQQDDRDFALLLDLNGHDDTTQEMCEQILSFAATAIEQFDVDVRGQVAVAVCGRRICHVLGRNRQEASREVMRLLATAEISHQPPLAASVLELAHHVTPGTGIFCVSSRSRPAELSIDPMEEHGETADLPPTVFNAIRWIEVASPKFDELFQPASGLDESADTLVTKWRSERA